MAPIPRCDLRLPDEPDARRKTATSAPKDVDDEPPTTEAPVTASSQPTGKAPIHGQRSETRDSAEILEDADEFSTGVTRDMVEVREHKLHEEGAGADGSLGGEEETLDACAKLAQCRAEAEDEAAAAAAAVIDEEDITEGPLTTAPPFDVTATPGDVCATFCEDRPESPSSGLNLREMVGAEKFGQRGADGPCCGSKFGAGPFGGPLGGGKFVGRTKIVKKCQGKYAPVDAYPGLWGNLKARKVLEEEMRAKRELYEGLHERNRRRREKERRRRQERALMMRCRDQAKITEAVDNIVVNKAFYLRFNYNKRLPYMPSAMTEHLRRFKKPPFKFFPKGSRPCRKEVDEFAKLRVTEVEKAEGGSTTPAPAAKKLRSVKGGKGRGRLATSTPTVKTRA